jgi:hypothetical protein
MRFKIGKKSVNQHNRDFFLIENDEWKVDFFCSNEMLFRIKNAKNTKEE